MIHGKCASGFEAVRDVFEASFERGEVGAGVAVMVDGEIVVDLWGGFADAARSREWTRDTIVNTYSVTKGMTAICVNRLLERGQLDLEAPVSRYWPEFAAAGKGDVSVLSLLTHAAGLIAIESPLSEVETYDWPRVTAELAAATPEWEPGARHGYHALTFGYLLGELVRRVDGRTLGTFFREEVAEPLGADFHIGFGESLDERCADIIPEPPDSPDFVALALAADPDSPLPRVFGAGGISALPVNRREWRAAEIPAGNGHGTATSLARIYGALARGGEIDGVEVLSPRQIEEATIPRRSGVDAVLSPIETRFGLGFMLNGEMIPIGQGARSFGHPGAGGALAFADPDLRMGFGYVMNQLQMGIAGSTHGQALVAAAYESMT